MSEHNHTINDPFNTHTDPQIPPFLQYPSMATFVEYLEEPPRTTDNMPTNMYDTERQIYIPLATRQQEVLTLDTVLDGLITLHEERETKTNDNVHNDIDNVHNDNDNLHNDNDNLFDFLHQMIDLDSIPNVTENPEIKTASPEIQTVPSAPEVLVLAETSQIAQNQFVDVDSSLNQAVRNFQRGPPPAYHARNNYRQQRFAGKPYNLQDLLQMEAQRRGNYTYGSPQVPERHVKRGRRGGKRISKTAAAKQATNVQVAATYNHQFSLSGSYDVNDLCNVRRPDFLQPPAAYGNAMYDQIPSSENPMFIQQPNSAYTQTNPPHLQTNGHPQKPQTTFNRSQPLPYLQFPHYRVAQRPPFGHLPPQISSYSATQQQQNPMLNALLSQPFDHGQPGLVQQLQQRNPTASKENKRKLAHVPAQTARQSQYQTKAQFFSSFNQTFQAPRFIATSQQWQQYGGSNQMPEHNLQSQTDYGSFSTGGSDQAVNSDGFYSAMSGEDQSCRSIREDTTGINPRLPEVKKRGKGSLLWQLLSE